MHGPAHPDEPICGSLIGGPTVPGMVGDFWEQLIRLPIGELPQMLLFLAWERAKWCDQPSSRVALWAYPRDFFFISARVFGFYLFILFFFFFDLFSFCLFFPRFWWKNHFFREATLFHEKHNIFFCEKNCYASPKWKALPREAQSCFCGKHICAFTEKKKKHSMCLCEKYTCASTESATLHSREAHLCFLKGEGTTVLPSKKVKSTTCASARSTSTWCASQKKCEKHNCASRLLFFHPVFLVGLKKKKTWVCRFASKKKKKTWVCGYVSKKTNLSVQVRQKRYSPSLS